MSENPESEPESDPRSSPKADLDAAQDERLMRLSAKARGLPRVAGVYLMKDAAGVVLYVGKATVLPNRVSTYFQSSTDLGPRKSPMLRLIDDFDVLECDGEWEALLLEARLIKDIRPRFNERLVDGKTFPYLAITVRDEFPGVFVTRNPGDARFKGARIFGPFTSVTALRHSVQLLQRVFKYRTCELEIRSDDPKNRSFRPCLLHSIGQCTAPCANRISPEGYREDIDRFIRFLGSKRSAMLREMRQEMEEASASRRFERAAVLRDQIRSIERLDERERRSKEDGQYDWQPEVTSFVHDPGKGIRSLQKTLGMETPIRCLEAIDIAHLAGGETVGSKVCFIDGRPFKDGYRRFKIRTVDNDDYMAIREVVSRRYREAGDGNELYPDVILIDGGLGQLNAAIEAFEQLQVKPPMVISLAKKEELIFVQRRTEPIRLGRENLGLKVCQAIRDEAHRFAQHYHHLLRTKAMLGDAETRGGRKKPDRADDGTATGSTETPA
ncbi:MAG: excinuclease ABC subunit UvrC [Phycisphaerales bacterium]|nr:excinuclease ABC subunit UvrC [Phycisphaerales bacterium]